MAGALVVKSQLRTRGIQIDTTCTLCGQAQETVCHMLFHCPSSKVVWDLSGLPLPPAGFSSTSIFLNVHYLLSCSKKSTLDPKIRLAFPWVLWHIWKHRNLVCFENRCLDANNVWGKAIEEASVWLHLNSFIPAPVLEMKFDVTDKPIWVKPPQNMLKCNVGSAWSLSSGNSGASWITRNHAGTPLLHSRRSFAGIRTQLEADLLALAWAVEALADVKVNKAIIEISSVWLPATLSLSSIPWNLHHLLRRISRALDCLQEYQVVLTNQGSNAVATRARSALQQ